MFLFRRFKIDTIVVYDPSGLYERNPDHYVTTRAVEMGRGHLCHVRADCLETRLRRSEAIPGE